MQGKTYDLTSEPGLTLYRLLRDALASFRASDASASLARDLPDASDDLPDHPSREHLIWHNENVYRA